MQSLGIVRRPPYFSQTRNAFSALLKAFLLASLLLFALPLVSQADTEDEGVQASPKPGWGEFEVVEEDVSLKWWQQVALWPVNRVIDFLDIFRVDVGVGGSKGGVVRITKYGNVGYRSVSPASVRVGLFGRNWPAMIESSSEFGVGPSYVHSKDREVCQFEVGAGVDLFVGAYGGICVEEVVDFVSGIFFLDTRDDDIR